MSLLFGFFTETTVILPMSLFAQMVENATTGPRDIHVPVPHPTMAVPVNSRTTASRTGKIVYDMYPL